MTKLPPIDLTPRRYKRHRFPAEIIAHWLYYRFPLSLGHVEAERGIEVWSLPSRKEILALARH